MENYLCRKYVNQVKHELECYFLHMQKQYNIWNTSFEIISETEELRTRSNVLKDFSIHSERVLEHVLQYMERDTSLMKTVTDPYVDESFHYRSKIIFPNKQLYYALISGSDEPDFILAYLKLILKHEIGHAIVTNDRYQMCPNFIEFALRKRVDDKLRNQQLLPLNKDDPDYYIHYYTEVDDEREANEAVGISIEEMVRFHKRYDELVNRELENNTLFSYVIYEEEKGDGENGN